MDAKSQDEMEIDLREIFGVLLSRIWLILLVGVVFAGGTGVYCKFIATPIYTSTTQLCVLGSSMGVSLSNLSIGTQLTQDYIVVVQSRPVVEQVIDNLELDMTYEKLLDATTVDTPTDTRILSISVTNPDPALAKQIVDQYAQVSRKRIAELMDVNEPTVLEEGYVAEKKTSPTTTKNVMLAGILGVFLASAIVIVRYVLDDTIKSSEDIERYLGLNTIGILPVEENELREEQREGMTKQIMKKWKRKGSHKGGKK